MKVTQKEKLNLLHPISLELMALKRRRIESSQSTSVGSSQGSSQRQYSHKGRYLHWSDLPQSSQGSWASFTQNSDFKTEVKEECDDVHEEQGVQAYLEDLKEEEYGEDVQQEEYEDVQEEFYEDVHDVQEEEYEDVQEELYEEDHDGDHEVDVYDNEVDLYDMSKFQLRDFKDPDDLDKLIQSGRLAELALPLTKWKGLDMSKLYPLKAVQDFFERYTATQDVKSCFYYTCSQSARSPDSFIATLHTPAFYKKAYTGLPKRTEHQAKSSAAEVFTKDREVLIVADLLPPSLSKIKQRVNLNRQQKDALIKAGKDPAEFSKRMVAAMYTGFRPLGLRSARWDGQEVTWQSQISS